MILVEHLTKYYGDHLAVDDLSFEIPDGRVYGFLGPNGAGKTTTMNIMTGCLSATDGKISIDGHDIFEEPMAAKKCIGYLPEQPPLYMNESPLDYLQFVGRAKGLHGMDLKVQIERIVEKTGIENVLRQRISTLSKGYKQRVGIAQALLGNPKVIILDEPTVGLDPLQIIEIRELIKSLGKSHTVIFSSHILSEVQTICDEILMISNGKLVAFDTPENLENQMLSPNRMVITTDATEEEARRILKDVSSITEMSFASDDSIYLRVNLRTDLANIYDLSRIIFQCFASSGFTLLEMNLQKANLEDLFIELAETQEESAGKVFRRSADDKKDNSYNSETQEDPSGKAFARDLSSGKEESDV